MHMQPKGSHFIDGSFIKGEGESYESIYPATAMPIAQINEATDDEIEYSLNSAQKGFEIWQDIKPQQRAQILRKTAEILRKNNREIASMETFDTGKPIQETLVADALSAADCLEYFAAQINVMTSEYIKVGTDSDDFIYTKRYPLGVCLGIGAWNYPIQIACWKAAPALACGNSMIFKPSEITPLSTLYLAKAFKQAGLPDGVFNVIQGKAKTAIKLVENKKIAKISFTGSVATATKIMKSAAKTLKQLTFELGGKSPLIIFDDADINNAVNGAMLANFYSSGQVCTNATRVFIHEKIKSEFVQKLLEKTKKLIIGDPMAPQTQIGPLISAQHLEKTLRYLQIGTNEAELLIGGRETKVKGFEKGYWIEPTVFDVADDEVIIAKEEIFAPVLSLLTFKDEDEVIMRANQSEYGLAGGVFTSNLARAHRVADRLKTGICWINTYNITPVQMPFGGTKMSGFGRENGSAALQYYSQIKSVYVAVKDLESPY